MVYLMLSCTLFNISTFLPMKTFNIHFTQVLFLNITRRVAEYISTNLV